jgi:hypothetical protein
MTHRHRIRCAEKLCDNERCDIGGPNARERVGEAPRAIVTAGLAKEVDAVSKLD